MILSPYNNPPYRKPTPNNSVLSTPPHDPHPKRKRSELQSWSKAAQQDPDIEPSSEYEPALAAGPDSPRSIVADELKDLDIQQPDWQQPAEEQQITLPPPLSPPRKRKRVELNLNLDHPQTLGVRDNFIPETPEHQNRIASVFRAENAIREVCETPDSGGGRAASPSTCLSDSGMGLNGIHASNEEAVRMPASPFRRTLTSAFLDTEQTSSRAISPLPSFEDLSPEQATLTWREDEITGHDIDPASDDDGEGINGIGFKPTPAVAYVRQQRRRRQVNEWKAREAREERQRRIERRRAGTVASASAAIAKRKVRFLGAG